MHAFIHFGFHTHATVFTRMQMATMMRGEEEKKGGALLPSATNRTAQSGAAAKSLKKQRTANDKRHADEVGLACCGCAS